MEKIVQKTTAFERFVHLLMGLSGVALLLTGLGFLYQQELGWLNKIFGGHHVAIEIHNWGGVVFAVSVFLSVFIWLKESLSFTKEDSEWIGMLGGYLSKDKVPPPQGKLNAGQKLVVWIVVIFGILISVTGFLMWLDPGVKGTMTLYVLLHNIAAFFFAIFIPLHIYLATACNPGTFRIMTRGTVPLSWAKKRHAKWVKEMGLD